MKMKRILSLLLCFVMLFSLVMVNTTSVCAAEKPIKVRLRNYMANYGHTWTKEKYVKFTDVQPQIINGRTMIPIRAVAEELGYEVSWDQSTKEVTLFRALTRTKNGDYNANQYRRFYNMMYNLEAKNSQVNPNMGNFIIYGLGDYKGKDVTVGLIDTYGDVTPEPVISASLWVNIKEGKSFVRNDRAGYACATYYMDVAPIVKNGRTLVPLRAAAEMLGLTVEWDGTNRIVTISA